MPAFAASLYARLLFATGSSEEEERRRFDAESGDPGLAFERYFDQIFRYCRQRLANDSDAEDVCSQVFAEAIKAFPKLRWKGRPVLAFLYTVAARRLVDQRRKTRPSVDIETVAEPASSDQPLEILAATGLLGKAIGELHEDQRLCVYLQVVQGYSFAELARITGRSEKACKGLVYRGLERVRKHLGDEGLSPT